MDVAEWMKLDLVQRQEALDAMTPEERTRVRASAAEINRRREREAWSKKNAVARRWGVLVDRLGGVVERYPRILVAALILLASFGFYQWCVALYESGKRGAFVSDTPSNRQRMGPAASSSSGYAKGYELGLGMGRNGAGSPTDGALRAMANIHAPDDQLQFRIGYRNGLLAGQQERAAR